MLTLAPRNLPLWILHERWMPRRLPLQLVLRIPPSSYRWQLLCQSGLWSIKCGNQCVHNCSSLMHTPNPNQKPNGCIQDSAPAAAYKVETTLAFSLVPPTSPPQLAMKVSANGPQARSWHVPNTKQFVRSWLNWSPLTPGNLGLHLNFSDTNYTLYIRSSPSAPINKKFGLNTLSDNWNGNTWAGH
jgi:hypothetical protein